MTGILEGKVALVAEATRGAGRAIDVELCRAGDKHRRNFNGKTPSSFYLSRIYRTTDLDGYAPDSWRYVVEIQDKGLPDNETGYR